jgi:DNA mismatch repair protein MutS2
MTTQHPQTGDNPSEAPDRPPEGAFSLDDLMAQTLDPIGPDSDGADGSSSQRRTRVDLPAKTLQDLQWNQVLALMAGESVTPKGSEIIPNMMPLSERGAVDRRLAETSEAMRLLAEDDAPPLVGLRDIRRALLHVTREGALVGEDLAAIARNCDVASRNHRFFSGRDQRLPYLGQVGRQIDPCDELRRELHHAIDPGGQVSDQASSQIRKLRRSVQNQHDRLRSRVEQLLRRNDIEAHLQDDFFTMREDRYVLPVRVGAKTQVPGIVHGYSSSGKTAFIEPTELVDLNNELRWAEIELQEEENRLLERLSRLVAEFADRLKRNNKVLTYLDVVMAGARFGERIKATIPELSQGRVELRQVRHPLLYLQHLRTVDGQTVSDVVPNDLIIDPDKRVLVISGPNTGGKTVLLKSLGLCALMAHCGLPIPADDGSKLPLYKSIFSDIGDEQSIEQDLSTFSGHLTNINTFLGRVGPESLVLLDELFTGTDPLQGAALAVSLLEELAERGATASVTTHLENLKTLAIQNDAFANASMGFDVDQLEPTYRLTLGIPGSSFAVRIARRLGFPDKLVERSLEVLEGEEHHSVDEVLASLEDQMGELRSERNRFEQQRRHAERQKEKYEKKYQDLRKKERESVHEETRELKKELREARDLIRSKIKEVQQSKRVERGGQSSQEGVSQKDLTEIQDQLRDAEQTIEEASDKTRPPKPGPEGLVRVPDDDIEEGLEVFVPSFNRKGSVLQFDAGQDQALVQIGALKANVDADELYYPSEAQRRSHKRGRRSSGGGGGHGGGGHGGGGGASKQTSQPTDHEVSLDIPQTGDNTVDLRGLRVDEAIEKVEMFMDHAFLKNRTGVHIIHGHGTGALKRGVRGYLVDSPYASDFRPGNKKEGGDGVTVAALAAQPELGT